MGIGDRVRCKVTSIKGTIHSRFNDIKKYHMGGIWWRVVWDVDKAKKPCEASETVLEKI